MSTVLTVDRLHHAYGPQPLLDQVSFAIESGERVCLLGRNGEGKSTLLKAVAGELTPDAGSIRLASGARLATLPQALPEGTAETVYEWVAGAFPETRDLLVAFERLSHTALDQDDMKELQVLQDRLEALDGWSMQQKIHQTLQRFGLEAEQTMAQLSGGWRRRVLLARALVAEPDLLLLDEPTNHLDIPAIRWLESTLAQYPGAILFISHDRAFVRAMATRIMELDRGCCRSWAADYDQYLKLKEKALEEEARHQAEFAKKLAQEEAWIRQGIKARRTRNMGRVRALKAMREAYSQRRERLGESQFSIEEARASGKLVVEARQAGFAWPSGEQVIAGLDLLVMRGDKLGLIGENGTGKTTLVRLLLGDLQPTEGEIRLGTQRQVAYFDQLRDELDLDRSALDNLAEGREFIEINGQRRHALGYLQDFLFSPERARSAVRLLSGGERARLMLAKLFSKPANILVLDEPTNDLDVETLELLEAQLVNFSGTVLLISHDRAFLDNVVTGTLFLDGSGRVEQAVGGYEDWRRQGGRFPAERASRKRPEKAGASRQQGPEPGRKLSYKLKRELESLPAEIASLEARIAEEQQRINDPAFYEQASADISQRLETLAEDQRRLDALMERWVELEEMAQP